MRQKNHLTWFLYRAPLEAVFGALLGAPEATPRPKIQGDGPWVYCEYFDKPLAPRTHRFEATGAHNCGVGAPLDNFGLIPRLFWRMPARAGL